MKEKILYTALATALLTLGCCADHSRDFDACGQIEATEVLVSAEANGRIVSLQLTEGDRLTAGQTVGVIDSVQTYLQKQELVRKLDLYGVPRLGSPLVPAGAMPAPDWNALLRR